MKKLIYKECPYFKTKNEKDDFCELRKTNDFNCLNCICAADLEKIIEDIQ